MPKKLDSLDLLSKVNRAATKLMTANHTDELYEIIVRESLQILGGKYGTIILSRAGQLERMYSNSPLEFRTRDRFKGNLFESFKERKFITSKNQGSKPFEKSLNNLGIKTSYFIPLHFKGKPFGVLIIDSERDKPVSEEVEETMKLFGYMITLAIRKAQHLEESTEALKLRDLFISLAAHELRTPLTTIGVYAQLLNSRMKKNKDETAGRWSQILSWEVVRLTRLIDELLVLKRIKTGELQYQWHEVSLREILSRSFIDFSLSHPDRRVIFSDTLKTESDTTIGDFDKLMQVFLNLLINAAKFSDQEITVNLKSKDSTLIVEITDLGTGIRKEDLSKIFEGFYKGQGNEKEGMGLGLFLAKSIIEKHKGAIRVKSKLGQGTTFTVQIPQINI
jgi:signal transduction histidine kinase